MADSVQDNFHSDFHVKTDDGSQLWLPSNNVSIPAYHKIYNFGASQVFNAQQSITGDVQLQWQVRHPESQDIMESDMFEIQRAVKPDFSDAQSVGLLPWMRDSAIYQFTDLAENVLAALSNDTSRVDSTFHSELSDIEIYDGNKLVAMINASMNTDIMEAGNPLYYRVRRASAATWGWNESPYMATAQLLKANYLAPLAIEQPPYTLDADFENNRTVHFNLKISNDSILPLLPDKDSLTFDYNITSVYNITVPLTIDVHGSGFATFIEDYYYTATQDKGDHIDTLSMSRTDWQMSNSTLTTNAVCGIPVVLSISHSDATFGTTTQSCTFTPTYGGKADVSIYSGLDMANLYIAATVNSFTPDSICEPVDSVFAQCFKPDIFNYQNYQNIIMKKKTYG